MNDETFDPDADLDLNEDIDDQVDEIAEYEPEFSSWMEFAEKFLLRMYPCTFSGLKDARWNKYWWRHFHAYTRIAALWRRYEQLRRDEPDTFLETFLRHHGDYHMDRLMREGDFFSHTMRKDQESYPLETASYQEGPDQGVDDEQSA
ncbi:DUF4913 domain-containing protein [Corynebacterium sp. 3HC-13]|uniref:DUF4913 domain-containing protein n=1 Tax=Corynebacterium poyangense TaxID=2684405 RepID=UPI001CD00E83|nr:DUF4913 domain-containing protein [Corynebacterium poyangense]MBZ8176207.1 DUF4913 domain-containing protein [Corynebacterium poyangense]